MTDSTVNVDKTNKKNKGKTKKAMDPSKLTPEYIEEQRRLRNLKKEAKKQELIAQGYDLQQLETPDALRFKTRPLVTVSPVSDAFSVKIMSYNILAQALIRRKLFPTSGNALKWSTRSQVLLAEIKHYDPDILCVQEMDFIQYQSFWKLSFEQLGYGSKYHRDSAKNHGVCIFFKNSLFVFQHQSFIDYDTLESGDIPPRTITQNIGLLCCLEFSPKIRSQYNLSKDGIIVGTTHLFWHPFGTYERTRQTYLVLQKTKEFCHVLNVLNQDKLYYTFFAGDFNSQPFDAPYLSITAKPVTYTERAKTVISCSLSFQYSKNRGIKDGEEEEEGGNIEKFGKDQPKDPVPKSFTATSEQLQLVNKIQQLHNNLDMRAISLYSVGYKLVDEKNSGIDNTRNEPMYSNWAHGWRGLLDYIFVISQWDNEDYSQRIDLIEELESREHVKLTKLLRLPRGDEMGEEPSGQPRTGQYPSDHFCLMAEVELL